MEAGSQDVQSSERGVEKLMDDYLESEGFYRKKIAKDGSCLFRAVAEQVLYCQSRHTEVRAACVNYLRKNRSKYEAFVEGNFDEYLERLRDPQNWVGEVEISALALIYKHDFIIFQEPRKPPVRITENGFTEKVRLCFLNGNHYDSVYPKDFMYNAALCQSILYELLYKKVCSMDGDLVDACLKGCDDGSQDVAGECRSSEESDLDDDDDLWSSEAADSPNTNNVRSANSTPTYKMSAKSHLPQVLSQRVRKSLNPVVFRNVAYDVWLRSQRAQQKRDFCIAAGMQYAAGDKCKARLGNSGQFYSAYVQEVSPNHGPVMVFIEELGEKHRIPLCNLRPSEDEPQAWSTVGEKGRKQSFPDGNGQRSEWDTRPRRSAKNQSPATRGAVPNRMPKQSFWSSQVAAEEPVLSRTSQLRRTDPRTTTAPTPGAQSEECPDREEEQALLEIMQRDETNFPTLSASVNAGGNGKKVGAQVSESRKRTGLQTSERRGARRKGDLQEQARDAERSLSPKTGRKGEKNKPWASTLSPKLQGPVSSSDRSAGPGPSPPVSETSQAAEPVIPPPQPPQVPAQTTQSTRPPASAPSRPAHPPSPATHATPRSSPAPSLSTTSSSPSSAPGLVLTSCPTQPSPAPAAAATSPPSQPSPAPAAAATSPPPQPSPAPAVAATSPPPQPSPAPAVAATSPPPQPFPAPAVAATSPPLQPGQGISSTFQSSQINGTFSSVLVQAPQAHSLSPVAFLPPASTPVSQLPLPPCVIPTPPPQEGPATPSGFSSLPLDPPPYEVATNCPLGVVPQMRVSPGPATLPILPEHMSHTHAAPPSAQAPMPPPRFPSPFQDPLYPGFPVNDKDEIEMVPPLSLMRNGDDLHRDTNVLRFFYNLGIKAYTYPMCVPHSYIYPLYQAYLSACAMQPKAPPPPSYVTPWVASMSLQEGYSHVPFAAAGGRAPEQVQCSIHQAAGLGMEVASASLAPRHSDLCLSSDGRPTVGYGTQAPMQAPPRMAGIPWSRQGVYAGPPGVPFSPHFLPSSSSYIISGFPVQRLPSTNGNRTETVSSAELPMGKTAGLSVMGVTGVSTSARGGAQAEEKAATPVTDLSVRASVPTERAAPREGLLVGEQDPDVSQAVPVSKMDMPTPQTDHGLGEQNRPEERFQGPSGVSGASDSVAATMGENARGGEKSPYSMAYPRREHHEESDASEATLRNGRSYYSTSYRGRRGYDDGQVFRERGWRGGGRGPYRGRRGLDNRREYSYKERRSGESYPTANDKGQTRGRVRAYNQYHGAREVGHTGDHQRSVTFADS